MKIMLAAVLAFSLGSATVAAAGPAVSGFVGLVDGANTAKIDANGRLSVSDADARETARQAVILSFGMPASCGSFQCYGSNPFTVPSGTRLVITNITGWAHLVPADTLSFVGVQMLLPTNTYRSVFAAPVRIGHEPVTGEEQYTFNDHTEVRLESGTTVSGFSRTFATNGALFVTVYGYLVNTAP